MEVLLRYHHVPEISRLEVYKRNGGYQALAKAMRLKPAQIVDLVEQSGLRGRGGAGFSTAIKWRAVLSQERNPHYFVCNIAEGEPGSFKDRELLKNPHMVLEATAISAYAIGAQKAFLYLRGSFKQEEQNLKLALLQARNQQLLPAEIVIHRGEESYIAGEETAMLESLEGKRAIPRTKPPRPHEYGLWECPTVINNVETICNLLPILLQGPQAFRNVGTAQSTGTKLFCLSGQIGKPGIYELPFGLRLSRLLNDFGGGPREGRRLVAVFPGGPSTPILPVEKDPSLDFEGLQAAGSSLGTGGMIVVDDSSDLKKVAVDTARFFAEESCGACPPCSFGTSQTLQLFEQILSSGNRSAAKSILKIREICEMMKLRGQCAHNRAAAMTHLSFLNHFPEVFR
jgi:NADH-quinone oxidoreductase subunit F